jgi:23S rRNA (pseudouridine1915-N3)-methyltransferase
MNIKIISIGKIKSKSPEMELINEYIKRIKNYNINIIELEVKNFSNEIDKKLKEAELINKYLNNEFLICMDEHGKNLTSHEFADIMLCNQGKGVDIVFVIGGAFGIDKSILNKADLIIAFGKCTYPHKLLRVILIEQIYRAISIINNHPYHKE